MDLYLLSHRIREGRYHVPAELVAEAMLRWINPTALEPARPAVAAPIRLRPLQPS
jgi:hypothetical protein